MRRPTQQAHLLYNFCCRTTKTNMPYQSSNHICGIRHNMILLEKWFELWYERTYTFTLSTLRDK